MKRLIVFLLALFACAAVLAKEAAPLAEDEAVEKRMVTITQDLRCLVCQNESLAASQADLAQDLRKEVRELVKKNMSDQEIKDYLVSRYGDFVLYKPPVKATTWALWVGPFVLLVAGVAALVLYLRRRGQRADAESHLSDEERKRAEALLQEGNS